MIYTGRNCKSFILLTSVTDQNDPNQARSKSSYYNLIYKISNEIEFTSSENNPRRHCLACTSMYTEIIPIWSLFKYYVSRKLRHIKYVCIHMYIYFCAFTCFTHKHVCICVFMYACTCVLECTCVFMHIFYIVTYSEFGWRIIMGSELVYWHFFTITVNYDSTKSMTV
jgi:hypothetical protein